MFLLHRTCSRRNIASVWQEFRQSLFLRVEWVERSAATRRFGRRELGSPGATSQSGFRPPTAPKKRSDRPKLDERRDEPDCRVTESLDLVKRPRCPLNALKAELMFQ